jgi:outer membrane murein-binding lipoprotein Lpp
MEEKQKTELLVHELREAVQRYETEAAQATKKLDKAKSSHEKKLFL